MKHHFKERKFSNWLINKNEERIVEISIDHFHHSKNSYFHEKGVVNCKCIFEKNRKQITNIEFSGANPCDIVNMLGIPKYYQGQIPHLPSVFLPKRSSAPIILDKPIKEYFTDIKTFVLSQKLSREVIGVRHFLELKWNKEEVFRGDCAFIPTWEGVNYRYRWRMYVKGGEIYDCIQGRGIPSKEVFLSPLVDNIVTQSISIAHAGSETQRVVLSPVAFSFLLERILEPNLKGENVVNDRFFVKSRDVGKHLFGDLEVTDSPGSPHSDGKEMFDFEGCARKSKNLITKGVLANILMNLSLFNKNKCFKLKGAMPGNAVSLDETSSSCLEVDFPKSDHLNFEDELEGFCYITRLVGPHLNPCNGKFTLRCDIPVIFYKGRACRLPPMIVSGDLFKMISNVTTSEPFYSGKIKLPFLHSKFIKASVL